MLFHVLDCTWGSEGTEIGPVLAKHGYAEPVVAVAVGDVDIAKAFAWRGGFDPGCEVFGLRDGDRCVDEDGFGFSMN